MFFLWYWKDFWYPSFRALEDKTQVTRFFPEELPQSRSSIIQRTRLTHTICVDDTSRRLAKSLFLDSEVSSAIARAHDLGHTPFGHISERTLDKIMKELGYEGFNHNDQSIRVVELLEIINPNFYGLNLTRSF